MVAPGLQQFEALVLDMQRGRDPSKKAAASRPRGGGQLHTQSICVLFGRSTEWAMALKKDNMWFMMAGRQVTKESVWKRGWIISGINAGPGG